MCLSEHVLVLCQGFVWWGQGGNYLAHQAARRRGMTKTSASLPAAASHTSPGALSAAKRV